MKHRLFLWAVVVVLMFSIGTSAVASNREMKLAAQKATSRSHTPALVFETEISNLKWKYEGRDLWISVNLENLDASAEIDAFDLAVYCENAYEELIYPNDCVSASYSYSTFSITKPIPAGKTRYSGYCNLEEFSGVKYVYIAIKRYHIVKGDEAEIYYSIPNDKNTVTIDYDDLDWKYWEID